MSIESRYEYKSPKKKKQINELYISKHLNRIISIHLTVDITLQCICMKINNHIKKKTVKKCL